MNKKIVELIVFILLSIVMVGLSFKSLLAQEQILTGILTQYDCRLWKETALIYTHTIELKTGEVFYARTKEINCELEIKPQTNRSVKITVENTTLLSLSQSNKELLAYEVLVEDSKKSTIIVLFITILFILGAANSAFRLKIQRDKRDRNLKST